VGVAVEGTVLCARCGGVPRVLQAGVLPWSRSEPHSRVAPICLFRRGVASSRAESVRFPEGRLATLERGGDAGHCRGSRWEALERGGDCPAGPRGFGWAALCYWAVDWASLSPFLSFRLGENCWPWWA
jgi:hypothetical protein